MNLTKVLIIFLFVCHGSRLLPASAFEAVGVRQDEPSTQQIGSVVADIAIVLGSLVFHEFSHASVATLLGDDTPRRQGRLTLNPLVHLDVIGTACILLTGSGWAKPVEFNSRNFSHQHVGTILTALAGPLSNVFLAYLASVIAQGVSPSSAVATILKKIKQFNLRFAAFNLLPIPPLDGSHLYGTFLQEKYPEVYRFLYKYGIYILFALLMFPETKEHVGKLLTKMETLLSKTTLTMPEDTGKKEHGA